MPLADTDKENFKKAVTSRDNYFKFSLEQKKEKLHEHLYSWNLFTTTDQYLNNLGSMLFLYIHNKVSVGY